MDNATKPSDITSHTESLAKIVVPESTMIGHPSPFLNIWTPATEKIIVKEDVIKQQDITVSIQHGTTRTLLDYKPEGRRAKIGLAIEKLRHGPVLDLGNRIVYDARYVFNDNIAHLFGNHVANLGFAKHFLGLVPSDCTIILGLNTSQLAHRFFNWLGFETIETNRQVAGDLLRLEIIDELETYLLVPFIPELEPPSIEQSDVDKLFIARRSTRNISNEDEIWPLLQERGYERYYFEDIPLCKQWALVRDAHYIVATHGAALGFLSTKAGNPDKADYRLLEIFSPGLVADIFRKTTAAIGGSWMCCRGKITSEFVAAVAEGADIKAMDSAEFELHKETLVEALDLGHF